jgi:hypothetical protein
MGLGASWRAQPAVPQVDHRQAALAAARSPLLREGLGLRAADPQERSRSSTVRRSGSDQTPDEATPGDIAVPTRGNPAGGVRSLASAGSTALLRQGFAEA